MTLEARIISTGRDLWQRHRTLTEDDPSSDVKGGTLDFRPNSQQSKWWNLRDRKDQRENLWLIRKKRPKLVIEQGKYMLFSTVLYHEQIRREAWFLHDLSGDASQLSLPCLIRLECRHDVFYALGDARDRRDGERVSFFPNSPHVARRVEGFERREDLGFRDQRRTSATSWRHWPRILDDAHGEWNTSQALRLEPPSSRRSEGGQIVQELNSIRDGKYWDDAKGGWLDPILGAREDAVREEARGL